MNRFKCKSIFLGLAAATLCSSNIYAGIEGWKFENNNWKYYKEDRALKAWQQLNNNWYFFNEDGSLKTGWYLDASNNWYFLDSSKNSNEGVLLSGWQWIDGYCYYFENTDKATYGIMYTNTVVDGYRIDATGRWIDEKGIEYYEAGKGISTAKVLQGSLDTGKMSSGTGSGRGGGSGRSSGSGKGSGSGGGSSRGDIGEKTGLDKGDNNVTSNEVSIVEEKPTVNNSNHIQSPEQSEQNSSNEVNITEGGQNKSGTINNNSSDYTYNKPTENNGSEEEKTNTTQDNKISNIDSNDLGKKEDNQTNTNDIKPATSSDAKIVNEEEHKDIESENESDKNTVPENAHDKNIVPENNSNKNTESQNKKESNQDRADRLKSSFITDKNDNVVQYTNEDGEIRTIIWAKGINGPTMGEDGDFHKEITNVGSNTYIDYKAPFTTGDGWYDVNKTRAGGNVDVDKNLCFGAVSSNMLHWWFEQNIEYIDRYIEKNGDITRANRKLSDLKYSFKNQQDSSIFELFKVLFGNNEKGFYTDLLMDLFINGYTPKMSGGTNIERDDLVPDSRGGFFYDVFKGVKLTDRTYGGSYEGLGDTLKEVLGEGGLIGLSHKALTNSNHIVTLWGAEYDLNGKLRAVYISDSDDQNEAEDERDLGMKRYEVRNVGGVAKLSTNQANNSSGSAIGYLHILYLGSTQWENYFK